MSNLQELKNTVENPLLNKIKEIKNSGVEFRKLGEVVNILDKFRKPITQKDRIKGNYPYYGANGIQDYVNDYIFDEPLILMGEDGSCITKNNRPVLHYVNGKIWVNNHAHVLSQKDDINLKYVYYALQTIDIKKLVRGTAPIKLPQENIRIIEIPLPPLEVQAEIVRILDTFTELIKELIKEQELRKKQYSYYRDKLLTFETTDIKFVKLGEICERITKGTTPKQFVESGINFIKVEAISSNSLNKDKLSFVDSEQHNNFLRRSILQENDVLFCIAGATIGKTLLVTNDMLPANTNQALAIIRVKENVNPSFIKYILSSKYMVNYINKQITGGAQPNLNLQNLSNFEIQLPPLDTQKRIVDILDNFEKYTNDLQEGLPAEIEKRKKQYAYYRDELLRFERK